MILSRTFLFVFRIQSMTFAMANPIFNHFYSDYISFNEKRPMNTCISTGGLIEEFVESLLKK